MSIQSASFREELELVLREANLPTDVQKIIGRQYRFGCEHGSHHHILSGVIQAVEVSDEGGLDLYVSNPRFWGERLVSIKYSNGRWTAYVDIKPQPLTDADYERLSDEEVDRKVEADIAAKFFEGEFMLL